MNTKKVMSIVVLVTAATIFALSSVVVKPAIAQTFGGGADGGAGSSSTGSASTGSASGKYQEFKNCLSDAEKNGDVTEQQIRDCFSPIYNPDGGSDESSSDESSSDESSSDDSSSDDSSKSDK